MSWLYVPPEYCQSAPGPVPLTSESDWPAEILAQSVTLNGKRSRSRTWLRRSSRDFWIRHLYGAICEPSIAGPGVARWIGSLGESPVNPTPTQESEREPTMNGTSGPTPPDSSENSDPNSSSWKMFQESLGITTNSLGQSYEVWVTELRKDYSRRQKLALPTADSDSLSWPTPTTSPVAANKGSHVKDGGFRNLLEATMGLWRTPEGTDGEGGVMEVREDADAHLKLRDQAANWQPNWATPQARDYKDWDGPNKVSASKDYESYSHLTHLTLTPGHTCSPKCRRLNPHFAESLMGWPSGWSLLATVGTAYALSETGWSRWWPLMLSALLLLNRRTSYG